MIASLLAAALALQGQPSPAPSQPKVLITCPIPPAPLPGPLHAWRDAHPVADGFEFGRAVDVPAVTVATVRLAIQPSRPLTGDYLATAGFEVKTPGRYSVAVGGADTKLKPLWLDVAGTDRKPLKSVGHSHGPVCSSIAKVVDFDLKPGKYTLLATGLTTAESVRVLVTSGRN